MSKDKRIFGIIIGIGALICISIYIEKDRILNYEPLVKYQILNNLEEKYSEEFEAVDENLSYSDEYGYNLRVCSKNKDKNNYTFDAYKKKNEDEKYEYLDSYIGLQLKDDYAAKVNDIAKKYFKEFKTVINYTSEPFSDEYDLQNIKLEEIDYNPPISIRISPTFNNISEFESNMNLFIDECKKNNVYGSVTLIYLKSKKDLESEIIDSNLYQIRHRLYIENK